MQLPLLNSHSGKTPSTLLLLTSATFCKDFKYARSTRGNTSPKTGFTVLPIEDIGDVKEPSAGEEDKNKLLNEVCVVGARLNTYSGCVQCSAKVVADDEDPDVGQCVKCSLMQCLDVTTEEVCAELVVITTMGKLNAGSNM